MRLSASQLKTWAKCALQGKFKYVDKIDKHSTGSSAMMGTAVHLALEDIIAGKTLEEAKHTFVSYYDHPDNTPDYLNQRTTFAGLRKRGLDMIDEFFVWFEEHKHDIFTLGTEIPFRVPFGNHELSGYIDWLYVEISTGTLVVVDHKTGARPNTNRLRHDPQFTTYGWAIRRKEFWCGYVNPETGETEFGFENGEELFEKFANGPFRYVWFDHKNGNTFSVGPREDVDFRRLYRLVEQVERAIETETFVPDLNGDNCEWCDYKEECPVFIPESLDLDPNSL